MEMVSGLAERHLVAKMCALEQSYGSGHPGVTLQGDSDGNNFKAVRAPPGVANLQTRPSGKPGVPIKG